MKIDENTTLGELQEYVRKYSKERGFTNDPTVKFLKLVEEVGELSKLIGTRIGMKSDASRELESIESEMADVLLVYIGLANTLDVKISEIIERKDSINRRRTWK